MKSIIRNIFYVAIVLAMLAAGGRLCQAAEQGGLSDEAFTTTTTHVEADSLGRFLKIEIRGSEPPSIRPEPPRDSKPVSSWYLNLFGILSLDARAASKTGEPAFIRAGILKWPMFSFFEVDEKGSLRHGGTYINGNIFALFDGVVEKQEEPNALGGHSRYAQVRLIDSIPFTAFRVEFSAPEELEWEALDPPLMTTLLHRTDKDRNLWKVLNIPFLWVFRYDRDGRRVDTHLLDGPGVALFKRNKEHDAQEDWHFGDLLLADVMRGSREGDHSHFGFIESFSLGSKPLIALYGRNVERATDEDHTPLVTSSQYVRLPLLGPVFGTWKKEGERGSHFAPFPKLLVSKKNRPPAF